MLSLIIPKQLELRLPKKQAFLGWLNLLLLLTISGCGLFPKEPLSTASKLSSLPSKNIENIEEVQTVSDHGDALFVKLIKNDIENKRLLLPKGFSASDHIAFMQSEAPSHPQLKQLKRQLLDALVKTLPKNTTPDIKINTTMETRLAAAENLAIELEERELLKSILHLKTQHLRNKQAQASKAKAKIKEKLSPTIHSTNNSTNQTLDENEKKNGKKIIAKLPPLNLDTQLISNRDQKIASQISNWIPDMLQQPTNFVIQAHNMKDFRWLRATLKTNITQLKSDYKFVCDPFISSTTQPAIRAVSK